MYESELLTLAYCRALNGVFVDGRLEYVYQLVERIDCIHDLATGIINHSPLPRFWPPTEHHQI
jgi:hypothetical protein